VLPIFFPIKCETNQYPKRVTGEDIGENMTLYLAELFTPLTELNIPWASAYGNHDDSVALSRQQMQAFESTPAYSHLSLTQAGPSGVDGVTNYWVAVYDSDLDAYEEAAKYEEEDGKLKLGEVPTTPRAFLFFMDSNGSHARDGVKDWMYVTTLASKFFFTFPTFLISHLWFMCVCVCLCLKFTIASRVVRQTVDASPLTLR
jgi:hypothetical protein